MVIKKRNIKNEFEFSKWFEKNFKKLGYSEIIRKDIGIFPDFIMRRGQKKIKVELETLSSNFILHKHDKKKVDKVICIKKDINIGIPTKEVEELNFIGGKVRISATIDKKTMNLVEVIMQRSRYRNKSHVIEEAIKLFGKKMEGEDEK